MAKIINIHPVHPPEPPGALNIIHALHGLWAARVISQDAFFLGAQVCQQMLAGKISQVLYAGELAQSRYTTLSGTVYTGPIGRSTRKYVEALRELHSVGGLCSYLRPEDGDKQEHFTMSPDLVEGRDYSTSTPLHFRITGMPKTEYFERVNKLAATNLAKCSSLQLPEE